MVGLYGHLALALLFALPAWILWDGRTGGAFAALVLATSTLPDIDLVLQDLGAPVKHHGVTHTLVFVIGVAVIAGLVAVAILEPTLRRWWRMTEDETVQRGTILLFVTGGLVLGGLSHLFGDVLGADHAEPIEPLWPIVEEGIELGVLHFSSPWLNEVLLAVAVVLHLAVILSGSFPVEHRFRSWRTEVSSGNPRTDQGETA